MVRTGMQLYYYFYRFYSKTNGIIILGLTINLKTCNLRKSQLYNLQLHAATTTSLKISIHHILKSSGLTAFPGHNRKNALVVLFGRFINIRNRYTLLYVIEKKNYVINYICSRFKYNHV